MNKKEVAFVVGFFVFLFSSCSSSNYERIVDKFDNGKPKMVRLYKVNSEDTVLVKEIQYYSGGQKKIEGEILNNKKNGQWVFWFENGNKWSEGYFSDDLRVGKTLVYHENGALYYEGEYKQGKKEGKWIFYNPQEEIVNQVFFENGKMVNQHHQQ